MSPWHFCKKCDKNIIGDEYYGCMVCKRKQIGANIRFNYYYKNILHLDFLPNEILEIISNFASEYSYNNNNNNNSEIIYDINVLCWKSRMHSIIK